MMGSVFFLRKKKKASMHLSIIAPQSESTKTDFTKTDFTKIESNTEHTCLMVSSAGLEKSCDLHDPYPENRNRSGFIEHTPWHQVEYGTIVYIHNDFIPYFVSYILPTLNAPIVLVTGGGDQTIWQDFFMDEESFCHFVEHPCLLHWFAQNAVLSHPKLTTMPIGLALHSINHKDGSTVDISTPSRLMDIMLEIRAAAKPWSKRICCAYANFQFLTNTRYAWDRHDAMKRLSPACVFYEPVKVDRYQCCLRQSEYAFVISPFGGGYDCHRTWEALVLGCIPIVHSSGLNSLWEDLPVLVIDDWSDVSTELLQRTLQEFAGRSFRYEKLTLAYWVDQFRNKKLKQKSMSRIQ